MQDVALFPIPGSVSFPHMRVPLHVFEPRYRTMIQHCLDHNLWVAIAHTQGTLREVSADRPLKEALSRNASTYKPCDIFSAGPCQLVQTLDDGRMMIEVDMQQRFVKHEALQRLPFEIYRCETLSDNALTDSTINEMSLLKEKIITRLRALCADNPDALAMLNDSDFYNTDVQTFSFRIFGMVMLDSDVAQTALAMTNPLDRMDLMLSELNQLTG